MRKEIYQFSKEDAKRFADEQHIKVRVHGDELQFLRCPYCRGGGEYGFDRDTFAINLETGQFNCLRAGCGAKGNMLTLAKDFNFSLGRDVDEYYRPRRRFRDLRRFPRPDGSKPEAVQYMKARGISEKIVLEYGITSHRDNSRQLCIPFFDEDGVMQLMKYRNMDFKKGDAGNKEWSMSNCKPILFGMDHCDSEKSDTLVMTEGQIDSLSVTEAGIPNAVSVPNGAKGFTWIPYCWNFMSRFNRLIVFGDHEKGHITLLEEMKSRFHGIVCHVRPEDYQGCKDANEILLKYGPDAIRKAIDNAVPAGNDQIIKLSDVEPQDLEKMQAIITGIEELDEITGGLYLGSLDILTGERGNGKSTFASQIISRAIEQDFTTFIYSGELMDWMVQDWIDRQIAGPESVISRKDKNNHLIHLIQKDNVERIHAWYDDRCYIYDMDRALREEQDPEPVISILEKAIRMYGCNVFMVDNLMTAMDDDLRTDIYRQQSNFVKRLAVMAKKYNVLIILIAHPRKRQVAETGNDDVLGSSNITNLADVVMWYDRLKEDKNDPAPADRILQVTKNRLNGRTTKRIDLWFNQASKRISDTPGEFDWNLGWDKPVAGFEDVENIDEIPF